MKFILYHHKNKRLANYVLEYSIIKDYVDSSRASFEVVALPNSNSNKGFSKLPEYLRKLLFFAKPDLIICMDDGIKPIYPIFAFEISKHVPARDHWMQRFVNLVGCAQTGIPGSYIMPFHMPNRENFSGEIDSFFFFAYDRVMEIHKTPFYIADWTSTDGQNLDPDDNYPDFPKHEAQGMANAFKFLNLSIEFAIHGLKAEELMKNRLIVDLRNQIRKNAYQQIPKISDFKRLQYNMTNDEFLTTEELKDWLESKGLNVPEFPDRINKRNKNLIFSPIANTRNKTKEQLREDLIVRIRDKGSDPYLGQPLAFDYMFCRLGETPYERDINIIVDLSVLKFSDLANYHKDVWQKCPLQYTEMENIIGDIPTYTMNLKEGCSQVLKNFLRVYAFTADIIVFEDGVVYF